MEHKTQFIIFLCNWVSRNRCVYYTFSSYHNFKFVSRGGLSAGYASTPTTHHNCSAPAFLLIAFLLILVMNVGKWPRFSPYRKHCVIFCYSHVFMYMHSPIKSMYINSRGKHTFCCEVRDSREIPKGICVEVTQHKPQPNVILSSVALWKNALRSCGSFINVTQKCHFIAVHMFPSWISLTTEILLSGPFVI